MRKKDECDECKKKAQAYMAKPNMKARMAKRKRKTGSNAARTIIKKGK